MLEDPDIPVPGEEQSQALAMLSDFIGKEISLRSDTCYTQEQYDIVLL